MAAEKLYELFNDDRFDLVIVDTPPTREALDFLEAPQKLMNFLDHRVYRWLVMPARGGLRVLNFAAQPILKTIGRVIGADVLADAINFFQAFEGIEEGFRQRALAVQTLLKSQDSKYVVVASAHHDTIREAIFFTDELARVGTPVTGLIINRLQPKFGKGSASASITAARKADREGDADLAALHRNMAHLRHIVQAEEATLKPLLDAVGSALVVKLDQRAQDVHDLIAIADLGRDLVAATATR
jgi:anion-transporting  ArsA/GET3 family ATPase